MELSTSNVCLNCENLTMDSTCSKHQLDVKLNNYCDSHSFKLSLHKGSNCGNCTKFNTKMCPNSLAATAGLLCFSCEGNKIPTLRYFMMHSIHLNLFKIHT